MHLKSLTGLRWYAAAMVFLAHTYHFNYFGLTSGWQDIISELGHMGVSLFFVLSGFVLTINYPVSRCGFREFYTARFARIYPAYLLGVLAAIPIELVARKGNGILAFLSQILLLQGFSLPLSGRFNDVGWTLSVEAFFYVCFPIVTLFLTRGSLRRTFGVCLFSLAAVLFYNGFIAPPHFTPHRYPPQRLFEFFIGMTMGLAYTRCLFAERLGRAPNVAALFAMTLISAMILSPLVFKAVPAITTLSFLLYGTISAAFIFIVANLNRLNVSMPLLTSPLVVIGGEISFSFYLFHNLLLRYLKAAAPLVFGVPLTHWSRPVQIGAALAVFIITVFLSWIVFRFIETPGRKKIRNLLFPSPRSGSL